MHPKVFLPFDKEGKAQLSILRFYIQIRKITHTLKIMETTSKNIVLVGIMGSGKTTVGRRLALELNQEFL